MADLTEVKTEAQTDDLNFDKFFKEATAEKPAEPVTAVSAEPVAVAPVPDPGAVVATPDPAVAAPEPVDTQKLISEAVAATALALKPAPEPAVPVVPVVDPEVEQKIAKFREDWPEQAAIMDIENARQRESILKEVQAMLAPLAGQMLPLAEQAEAQAQAAHEAAILAVHPDAQTLLPEIEKWVDGKPTYLKDAYNKVLDAGASGDVVALVAEFKKETGKTAAAPVAQPDPEKERRLRSTEPVQNIRQATPGVIDPDDFEGAFKTASMEAQKTAA